MDNGIVIDSEFAMLRPKKTSKEDYYLYIVNFLSHPNVKKVGISKDVIARFFNIEQSSFLGSLDYDSLYVKSYASQYLVRKAEKRILKGLRKRQIKGEWFAINKDEIEILIEHINNNKLELIKEVFSNKIDVYNDIILDKNFIKNEIANFNKIHQSSFILYLILLAHSIDGKTSETSIKDLCKCSGLAKNTVCNIIEDLKNERYISKIGRNSKKITIYDLRGLN